VILIYATESLAAFRTGNYLSSTLMLGVAAEKTLLLLIEALRKALLDPSKRQQWTAKLGCVFSKYSKITFSGVSFFVR
jgi:hypothetical protein